MQKDSKYQLINSETMFDEKNEANIQKFLDESSVEDLRKSKSALMNEIFCYISLFIGTEQMKKIKEKLREKVKIKIDDYDEAIKGNLTLYQSEEEALKLFPDFRKKQPLQIENITEMEDKSENKEEPKEKTE